MANLILAMRPGTLGNKALPASIEEYLEKWERQNGIITRFLPDIEEQAQKMCVPPVVKETFFRIMQEALSNVARHSKASYVEIALSISCSQSCSRLLIMDRALITMNEKNLGLASPRWVSV
jgi:NarL family two-component system sensor histidine kinase LiaS